MNLKQMLEEVASRYGRKTAIVSGDRRLSYADLDKASNKLANALLEIGVNKGDRIATLLSNSPDFVIIYFGIVKAGATAVPLDPQYKIDELAAIFNDCLPEVLIADGPTLEQLAPVLSRFASIKHIVNLDSEHSGRHLSYQEIMETGIAKKVEADPEPDDIAQIVYTSGPSFRPRGIMLYHRCLVEESAISAYGYQQTDEDTMMLFALPMYHVYGLVAGMLASLCKGSTVVIVPGTGLSIGAFMAAIEKEKGTMFIGVPYIFALAVDMAEKGGVKSDLSSLRLCASCGAPLSISVIKGFKKHYGFDVLNCLGLTEGTCHFSCQPLDGSGDPESVGYAISGWEARVVDNSGHELPPNQEGEIILRGPIMKEYYNNPQATSEVIKNGWLYTGDIGKFGQEGNLFVTGRKKEIIILKGQNIEPDDIEPVLSMHPKVAEAAVIGIPDEMRGEIVGAVVSLKEGEKATEQEIKKFCHERVIGYKVPKQVFFMDSLPRTAGGKIDKTAIRQRLSIPFPFPEASVS
ncbi:class I adenylate-forming enzyme family protein [Chloroflexota bacterium]